MKKLHCIFNDFFGFQPGSQPGIKIRKERFLEEWLLTDIFNLVSMAQAISEQTT